MPSINSARYAQRIIQTGSHESPSFLRKVHRLDPPHKMCTKGSFIFLNHVHSYMELPFTLSSPGRPVHSDTVLGFSWKHSSHAAIPSNDYSLTVTFPPLSIGLARYSFIQLGRLSLRRREVKENAKTSKR